MNSNIENVELKSAPSMARGGDSAKIKLTPETYAVLVATYHKILQDMITNMKTAKDEVKSTIKTALKENKEDLKELSRIYIDLLKNCYFIKKAKYSFQRLLKRTARKLGLPAQNFGQLKKSSALWEQYGERLADVKKTTAAFNEAQQRYQQVNQSRIDNGYSRLDDDYHFDSLNSEAIKRNVDEAFKTSSKDATLGEMSDMAIRNMKSRMLDETLEAILTKEPEKNTNPTNEAVNQKDSGNIKNSYSGVEKDHITESSSVFAPTDTTVQEDTEDYDIFAEKDPYSEAMRNAFNQQKVDNHDIFTSGAEGKEETSSIFEDFDISEMNKQLAEAKKEKEEAARRLQESQQQCSSLEKEVADMNAQNINKKKEIYESLKEQLSSYQTETANINAQAQEMEQKRGTLENTLVFSKQQAEELTKLASNLGVPSKAK